MEKISEVYRENMFHLFVKYCADEGLEFMDELKDFDFFALKQVRGLGDGKIKKIIERYHEFPKRKENEYAPMYPEVDEKEAEMTVAEVFGGRHFNLFKRYCDSHGLLYMRDLAAFDLSDLRREKNFGEVYIRRILQYWNEYRVSGRHHRRLGKTVVLHPDNFELDVDCLKAAGLSGKIIGELKAAGAETIGDVTDIGTFVRQTGALLSPTAVKRVVAALTTFRRPAQEVVSGMVGVICRNRFYDLYRQKAAGKTLTAIGQEIGVSKERVRQMLKEVEKDMRSLISILVTFTLNNVSDKRMFRLSDITLSLDMEMYVVNYAIRTGVYPKLKRLDEMELFLVNLDADEFSSGLRGILQECIPDFEILESVHYKLNERLKSAGWITISSYDLIKYALKTDYSMHNGYIFRKADIRQYYEMCIRRYFPEGISIHREEELSRLKTLVREIFDVNKYEHNDRSLTVFLTRNLVLCDKGKYISPASVSIKSSLLKKIYRYIVRSDEDSFLYADLFLRFQDELEKKSSIGNKWYLHGVLKYYFSEDFYFTRDILKKIPDKISANGMIEEYLVQAGRAVSKEELRRQFPGISDAIYVNSVLINENILMWDYNYLIARSLLSVTDEERAALKDCIEKNMEIFYGYLNDTVLYDTTRDIFPALYERNHIENKNNIFSLCADLFREEYHFRRPHISRTKLERNFSIENVLVAYAHRVGEFSCDDLAAYSKKLGFSENTGTQMLYRRPEEMIRISRDRYVVRENFSISSVTLTKIFAILEKEMAEDGFLFLRRISDFSVFPKIDYEWNVFLLESVVRIFGDENHRLILPRVDERRQVKSAMVPANSSYRQTEDVIRDVLDQVFGGSARLRDFVHYLTDRKIISKHIPSDILSGNRMVVEGEQIRLIKE
ncbi:MAG: hypothetical protein E7409_04025 [Ruminococcaceae bacterium]|nr:hypothetical protein [Oscillospiraceae bacterium]